MSRAFLAYLNDLRTPKTPITYVDAALAPPYAVADALRASAAQPASARLAAARRMHPRYEQLRAALADYRRTGHNPSQLANGEYLRRLLLDMDRLRALPADPRKRHVLVDTHAARLWLYEGGGPIDSMKVVVGKRRMPTPALAGLIRYAVLNPYWNLPPDLIRERARRVVREGPELLANERLELLSGWEADARVLDPLEVDWAAVAAGTHELRMRQLPGSDNMMGAVKLMLPNRLGIYLHDTPDKAAFGRQDRRLSSGCVRVEDAPRLYAWLFGGQRPAPSGMPEEQVPLAAPVPVYLVDLLPLGG